MGDWIGSLILLAVEWVFVGFFLMGGARIYISLSEVLPKIGQRKPKKSSSFSDSHVMY